MAKVIAIALKSFYFEKEVKTRQSKPFEVDEHHFNELKQNKLVERAPEEKAVADDDEDAKAAAEAEAKAKEEADAKAAATAAKKAKA